MSNGKYHIDYVEHAQLYASPYQPKGRVDSSTSLNQLKQSIRENGLQYPPLVVRRREGDGFTIVDGHRRIAAVKALAWQSVPVIVAEGKPGELFSAVTGTTKALKAADWVSIYLAGGTPPSGPTRTCIKKLEQVIGRDFLVKLAEAGLSPQIWNVAKRTVNYLEMDNEKLTAVVQWIFKHKISRSVSTWMSGENPNPKAELLAAFEQDREPSLQAARAA